MKAKDVLMLIFASALVFAIGYTFYMLNNEQKKYDGKLSEKNIVLNSTIYLCQFSQDSLKVKTEYSLIKSISDSIIRYEYESPADSTRDFELSYRIETKKLYLNKIEFVIAKPNVIQNNQNAEIWFDNYGMSEPLIDGMSPLLFNIDYGILAITGPLGPTMLFLTKPNDNFYGKNVIKVL